MEENWAMAILRIRGQLESCAAYGTADLVRVEALACRNIAEVRAVIARWDRILDDPDLFLEMIRMDEDPAALEQVRRLFAPVGPAR